MDKIRRSSVWTRPLIWRWRTTIPQATRTLILQNQAQEITANLRPNPTSGATPSSCRFSVPQDFSGDNLNQTQQFDIGLGYLFERGHKRQHRLQAARDQTAVTRAQVTDAERTLAFNVGQQFVSVLLAESTLQFALQDLKGFQQTVDISESAIQGRATSAKATISRSSCSFCSFRPTFLRRGWRKCRRWSDLRELLGYNAVPAEFRRGR